MARMPGQRKCSDPLTGTLIPPWNRTIFALS
jgi:hypothetical protein